jgi:hypothetical protein
MLCNNIWVQQTVISDNDEEQCKIYKEYEEYDMTKCVQKDINVPKYSRKNRVQKKMSSCLHSIHRLKLSPFEKVGP